MRGARERDDVADVGHAGDEQQQALETEPESGVRGGTVFAGLQVPPDVGYINDKPFFSIAGVGFDAKVAYDFDLDPKRGFATYFKHILKNYFHYDPCDYHIEYDGNLLHTQAFFITFANSSQWGYNVRIAPMASLHDGKVNVCIVKRPDMFLKLLNVDLPKLLTNNIEKSDIVQYIECQNLRLLSEDKTPIYLHIDGDTAGTVEEVSLTIQREAMKAVVPLGLK